MSGGKAADESEATDGRSGSVDRYDEAEVLDVLKSRKDVAEPLTAREIGDVLDRSRSATYKKCMSLVEDGEIRSKKTGAKGRVFWIPLHTALFEGDTHG